MLFQLSMPVYRSFSILSEFSHEIHTIVTNLCSISISILELLSIGIILFTTFYSLIQLFKEGGGYARVYLLHGQSVGLTFKLGAEILKTVNASTMDEIWQIVMLVVIKAMMILLIDWELNGSHEHKSDEEMENEKRAESEADGPLMSGFSKMVRKRIRNYKGVHAHAAAEQEIKNYQAQIDDLHNEIVELQKKEQLLKETCPKLQEQIQEQVSGKK